MKKILKLTWFLICLNITYTNEFDPAFLAKQATEYEVQGDLNKALDSWIRAFYVSYPTQEIYDNLKVTFQKILGANMEASNYLEATKVLSQAETFFPNDYSLLRFKLYISFSLQDYNQTIFYGNNLLNAYLGDLDKTNEIHFYIGHAYHKLKTYSLALEHLTQINEKYDNYRSKLVLEGDSLYHLGNLEEGLNRLNEAQKLKETEDIKTLIEKISQEKPIDDGLVASEATPHFIIKSRLENQENLKLKLVPIIEASYAEFAQNLLFYPESPITIIVYAGENTLEAKLKSPNWAAGVYDGEIRISEAEVAKDSSTLERLLRHEIMHLFLDAFTRNQIPTWLNEGIAQYYEMPFSFEESGFQKREDAPIPQNIKDQQSQSLMANTTLKYAKLNGSFLKMTKEDAALAYGQSLLMTKYLIESIGVFRLRSLLREIYAGNRFDVSLKMVTDLSPEEFLNNWILYQKNTWKL